MENNIHYFKKGSSIKDENILEKLGIRGRLAMELSSIDLPILPGFIIDSDVASHLAKKSLKEYLKPHIEQLKKDFGRGFGDLEQPMLLKIVISPNLAVTSYPTLHNYGLTSKTVDGFNKFVGEHFGFHEIQFLFKVKYYIEY